MVRVKNDYKKRRGGEWHPNCLKKQNIRFVSGSLYVSYLYGLHTSSQMGPAHVQGLFWHDADRISWHVPSNLITCLDKVHAFSLLNDGPRQLWFSYVDPCVGA